MTMLVNGFAVYVLRIPRRTWSGAAGSAGHVGVDGLLRRRCRRWALVDRSAEPLDWYVVTRAPSASAEFLPTREEPMGRG